MQPAEDSHNIIIKELMYMAEKRTTKKEYFRMVIDILKEHDREDLIQVMEHEIALIEKKSSNAKLTKTQEANQDIKTLIIQELVRLGEPVTITDLLKNSVELYEATAGSNQKVSALMTQLKTSGQVVRGQVGKKAVFSVPDEN